MKRLFVLAALGAAVIGGAQTITEPTDVSFRLGGAYVLDTNMRDQTGNLMGVGIDYYLRSSFVPGGETYFSLDWLGKSASGCHGNAFPIMVNQRVYLTNDREWGRKYAFLGAGIVCMDVYTSKAVAGLRGGVGLEIGPHIFAEATATLSDVADTARCHTIGAYIGYRF